MFNPFKPANNFIAYNNLRSTMEQLNAAEKSFLQHLREDGLEIGETFVVDPHRVDGSLVAYCTSTEFKINGKEYRLHNHYWIHLTCIHPHIEFISSIWLWNTGLSKDFSVKIYMDKPEMRTTFPELHGKLEKLYGKIMNTVDDIKKYI